MKLVLLESPYKGDIHRNVDYARKCMRDSFMRGEYPFASHLLYTQNGILEDSIPDERALGIAAGLAWGSLAQTTVVYCDLGVTDGMIYGINRAIEERRPVEYRRLKK